ncbi:MAG TPA: adenylate/guanylate cyclase domain-containing protein [Acidimicrobiales bacterium]|nr:adenylate/guanylate cyclase domain-containing protein [Acidimicrobiales bacterium]
MHPETRYARTTDGVQVAYAVHGDGPPLVFVRGWISHLDAMWHDPEFRPFMEAIGRHHRVIRYDVRGCGLSDREPANISLDHLVLDLEAVIDRACRPEEPFVVYGTCYGGPIAVRYTARHPERVSRLVLDGTYARGIDVATPQMRESVLGMVRMLESQPKAAHAMLDFFTNPEGDDLREQRLERTRRAIDADAARRLYELSFEIDVTDDLRAIRQPALVLHRKRTQAVPFVHGQHVAALLPDATFVGVDGGAHNPWEGDATQPLQAMARFLGEPIDAGFRPRTSPRPTVILFTDREGSTATTARMGDDRAQELVRTHNAIIRTALESRGGRVVKSTGDGVMAAFASVSSAVACAIEIQTRLDEHNVEAPDAPIRVRMGINAGEPLSEEDDLHGIVVSTASRICDQARAGEILVSNVVRELASGRGLRFTDAGAFELKGLDEPIRLYRVEF